MSLRLLFLSLALLGPGVLSAQVIYQNPVGAPFASSHGVFDDQFLAARFSIPTTLEVSQVSAVFTGANNQDFFAAIVNLSSPTALPTGLPFDPGEVVVTALFNPGTISTDTTIDVPITTTLAPGAYAVVFGAGLFGSPASAGGGLRNYDAVSGSSSIYYLDDTVDSWNETQFDIIAGGVPHYSISITGTAIPESPLLGMSLGLAALAWTVRNRFRARLGRIG